jgi:hypothetical protein
VSYEQVQAASKRISRVLDELRKEGMRPEILNLAMIDTVVRMGRFYSPRASTVTILRRFASLANSMARDEKNESRREQH